MLPKERGGVVDSNLRVYGMKNIRVADLSIIPLHIAAHTQSKSIRPWYKNNRLMELQHRHMQLAKSVSPSDRCSRP